MNCNCYLNSPDCHSTFMLCDFVEFSYSNVIVLFFSFDYKASININFMTLL